MREPELVRAGPYREPTRLIYRSPDGRTEIAIRNGMLVITTLIGTETETETETETVNESERQRHVR